MSRPGKAVFLSYASQDALAARRIRRALRDAGVDVSCDCSGLRGGDAWETEVRHQINCCHVFIALISANTNARAKGCFRREWKIGVDCSRGRRTDDITFLLPVVIDDTVQSTASVPNKFHEVEWTFLKPEVSAESLCRRVRELESELPDAPVSRGRVPSHRRAQRRAKALIPYLAVAAVIVAFLLRAWWQMRPS